MTTDNPFSLARELAPEFEEILEVNDLGAQVDALNGSLARMATLERRDLALGDLTGMAGLLVSLIALILQIRKGNTYQNVPPEQIIERLTVKLSEETSLPPETREKLITRLLEKL